MYGLSVCRDDNHLLKLVANHPVHTDEPYTKLHRGEWMGIDAVNTTNKLVYRQLTKLHKTSASGIDICEMLPHELSSG